MKKLARIYRWIIISVLLQVMVLSYFNFVYFPGRGTIKTTMYENADDSIESKNIRIPSDTEKICVSFNGVFTAYKRKNNLIITDNKRKKTIKSINSSGGEITYFRWLPDRDMLIYSMKSPEGKKGQVKISTYDIGPQLERSYPEITELPEDSTVVDIELSPYTNAVYTLIKTDSSSAKVYKYNIMDNLTLVMKTGTDVIIKETAYSDNLIYQKEAGKLYVRSGKSGKSSSISLKGQVVLLTVDSEDNIYAGELDGDKKIVSLRYGKSDQQAKTWKQIKLDEPVLPTDIFVTPNGTVYRAVREENRIVAFGGKAGNSYDGELIDVIDDYIISKDGDLLRLTAMK